MEMLFKMEHKDDVYNLCIYDSVRPSYTNWDGERVESPTDANVIKAQLDEIPEGAQLNVYISSNGGDVKTGLAIYSQLMRLKCKKTAYIDGFACSIASVIPMACDKLIMYPTSLLMIHNASGACFGNATEHRKFADDLDVISSSAVTAYKTKAGDKLDDELLKSMLDAETWINAEKAVELGLCDEIIQKPDDAVTTPNMQGFDIYRLYADKTGTEYKEKAPDVTNEGTDTIDDTVDVSVEPLKSDNNLDINSAVDTFIATLFENINF